MEPGIDLAWDLALGFRFGVFFFVEGVPNPVDIRFQKVSGLSAEVSTTTVVEGGENLYAHRFPERVGYGNLVLERGVARLSQSPLEADFVATLGQFSFRPSNVIVTLFGDTTDLPVRSWMFLRAYPVKWEMAPLDATEERLVIDTLELAYARMSVLVM